jgi:hypothetical protein
VTWARLRSVLVGEGQLRRVANTLILLVLGLGLIRFSAQDLGEALHWGPRELSCEAWLDAPLETRWVSLTGCRLDLSSAASRTYKGWLPPVDGGVAGPRTLELFLPVSASEVRETPPRVVVSTSDRELLDVVDALARVPQPEVDAFIEAHRSTLEEKLKPSHLVGYVEPVASLASRSALKSMMIERAVVLEQDRAPPKANAIFGVLVGMVMLLVALWPIFNRIREPEGD